MEKGVTSESENKTPFIDLWIKSMIIGREPDGYQVFQENFLRQAIKEFPFQEATLFKTLVTNFHHCKNYGEGATAAEYINQAFNGQRGFKDFENCDTCGLEGSESSKKCSKCKYCLPCVLMNYYYLKRYFSFECSLILYRIMLYFR